MRLLFTILAFFWATEAAAQLQPPPQADSVSDTGVSYGSGAFNHDAGVDVSIGSGDFPTGLALHRTYQSSLNPTFSGNFSTPGWAHNLLVRVSNSIVPPPPDLPQNPVNKKFLYSVVWGTRRIGFNGGSTNPTGGPVGTYTPVERGSGTLVFAGATATGNYTFTSSDGTVMNFLPSSWLADTLTGPDGTVLKFNYIGAALSSVFSNRGYAILFEFSSAGNFSKACAVNLAVNYVQDGSPCPAGVPAVTYGYGTSTVSGAPLLTSVTSATGGVTQYSYGGYDHLTCITPPGASSCAITNTYSVCQRTPPATIDPPFLRLADQVLSQTLADGRSVTYSFDPNPYCPRSQYDSTDVTKTVNGTSSVHVVSNPFGIPTTITDELGRTTNVAASINKIRSKTEPEGNQQAFSYDSFSGYMTATTDHAKPSSGLADQTISYAYPTSCTPATCAKPVSMVDRNGNETDYTYDSVHGGVLTETAPADSHGVRAVKRYAYTQRYAWIKNATGSFSQAASPVWVQTEMRSCRTTATVSGACAGGTTDEVLTSYEYGPDTGAVGNNLWPRGVAVTSYDAVTSSYVTLRTCYGYDMQGNKISETKPRGTASLTVCP